MVVVTVEPVVVVVALFVVVELEVAVVLVVVVVVFVAWQNTFGIVADKSMTKTIGQIVFFDISTSKEKLNLKTVLRLDS